MYSSFLYKLIILYMLDRVNEYALTNEQINGFIMDKGYTDFINMYDTLADLIDKGFMSKSVVGNNNHYRITSYGEEAISYFENRIPNSIKQDILDYFKQEKITLKNRSEIYADYYPNSTHQEYIVECVIKERKETLVNIKLTVPDETIAKKACKKWSEKSSEVYSNLIKSLWVAASDEDADSKEEDLRSAKKSDEKANDSSNEKAIERTEEKTELIDRANIIDISEELRSNPAALKIASDIANTNYDL